MLLPFTGFGLTDLALEAGDFGVYFAAKFVSFIDSFGKYDLAVYKCIHNMKMLKNFSGMCWLLGLEMRVSVLLLRPQKRGVQYWY